MRTAKVKVNRECGVARPIRIHLTVLEANRLATLLGDTNTETGYDIDSPAFYNDLSDVIEIMTH